MNKKELRKLRKIELLEILLAQSQEIDRLTEALRLAEEALEDRSLRLAESGNIAEAALKVTAIFEEAQRAADLYLENIKQGKYDEYDRD